MKKMMTICMVACVPAIMFGAWKVTNFKADELQGTKNYIAYSMGNRFGQVILYSHEPQIKFVSDHIFDSKSRWLPELETFHYWVLVKVGIYDNEGNLTKKGNMHLGVVRMAGSQGYVYEPDKITTTYSDHLFYVAYQISRMEIYNTMCKPGWSVRFIAPTYGSSPDFDVTIKADDCFKTLKWIEFNVESEKEQVQAKKLEEKHKKWLEDQKEKKRLEEEAKAKTKEKLHRIEVEYKALEKRMKLAEKKGYNRAAKKYREELNSLKQKMDILRKGI